MNFHPMSAGLQMTYMTKVKRPDGQINVSESAEDYLRHVEVDRKVFKDLRIIYSFKPLSVPDSYSLASWQTPIRDQRNRATCYAFACIAAMEAMYNRTYGLSLDLSEQYAFQLQF